MHIERGCLHPAANALTTTCGRSGSGHEIAHGAKAEDAAYNAALIGARDIMALMEQGKPTVRVMRGRSSRLLVSHGKLAVCGGCLRWAGIARNR